MAIRLTLIAHAPTAATRMAAFPRDEPVDRRGLEQAHSLAGVFAQPRRVWTGPERRALETATALGIAAVPEPQLRDADCGRWAGRTFEEISATEPEALAAWMHDPAAAPHGGESLDALLARVAGWMDARREEPGHGLAVTHAAVIRAAIVHALGAPAASFWRLDVAPLSCTEVRPNARRWTLRAMRPFVDSAAVDDRAGGDRAPPSADARTEPR